jgi:hypothetical protein
VNFVWVYQTKFTFEAVVVCHKSLLVEKGFPQQEGIEYTKKFSLVAKTNSVRLIVSLVSTRFGWKIHQMDVKSVFPRGDLFEDFSMEKPLGFVIDSKWFVDLRSFFMV